MLSQSAGVHNNPLLDQVAWDIDLGSRLVRTRFFSKGVLAVSGAVARSQSSQNYSKMRPKDFPRCLSSYGVVL